MGRMTRVAFSLTPDQRKQASDNGYEYAKFDGQSGVVLCGAGNGGAWVRFDGQAPHQYIGVPAASLTPANDE